MNLWLIVPAKPFDEGKSRLADTLLPSERAAVNKNLLTHVLTTTNTANIFTGAIVISRSQPVLDHARTLQATTLLEDTTQLEDARLEGACLESALSPVSSASTHLHSSITAQAEPAAQAESIQSQEGIGYPCCAATSARYQYTYASDKSKMSAHSGISTRNDVAENGQYRRTSLPKEERLNRALTQATQAAIARGADAILVLPTDLPLLTVNDVHQLYRLGACQKGVVLSRSQDGGTNALLLRPPSAINFAFGINSFQQHYAATIAAGYPCQILESPTLAFDLDGPEDWVRWQESEQRAAVSPLA